MRKWTASGVLMALGVTSALCSGACGSDSDGGGLSGPTSTGGAGGDGGAGGGLPAGCIPSEAGGPVDDSCGVFVSSSLGDDGSGDGSKAAPYATLGKAVAEGAAVIYACTDGFDESLTLTAGTSLFGGVDCQNGWSYVGDATKTALTAAADAIPLTLAAGNDTTHVHDMDVTAASAAAPGGSSIAMVASGVTATIVGTSLTAGDGAAGTDATALAPDSQLDGEQGKDGVNSLPASCGVDGHSGGAGGEKTCDGNVVCMGEK